MKILDSTLTCSNLAVKTQTNQPPVNAIKHLNNNCVVVLLRLKNILLMTTIIPVNLTEQFSIQHCNISAKWN